MYTKLETEKVQSKCVFMNIAISGLHMIFYLFQTVLPLLDSSQYKLCTLPYKWIVWIKQSKYWNLKVSTCTEKQTVALVYMMPAILPILPYSISMCEKGKVIPPSLKGV